MTVIRRKLNVPPSLCRQSLSRTTRRSTVSWKHRHRSTLDTCVITSEHSDFARELDADLHSNRVTVVFMALRLAQSEASTSFWIMAQSIERGRVYRSTVGYAAAAADWNCQRTFGILVGKDGGVRVGRSVKYESVVMFSADTTRIRTRHTCALFGMRSAKRQGAIRFVLVSAG